MFLEVSVDRVEVNAVNIDAFDDDVVDNGGGANVSLSV